MLGDFIGKKIILVDFWTYSCINCQRTIPYLEAWHKKYNDLGLEIIGVHTPEFEFEKEYNNVRAGIQRLGITYSVVQDNDYKTWRAFENRYWPRKYLINLDGKIVYDHIGEGEYEETEKKIQELLKERAKKLGGKIEIPSDFVTISDASEAIAGISPEIYFGSNRNSYLGNGKDGAVGVQHLTEPTGIKTNILYLVGDWNFQPEYAENQRAGDKIIFRYQGKNVFLVASSPARTVSAEIFLDGEPVLTKAGLPTEVLTKAGEDIAQDGGRSVVSISDARLYRLINDQKSSEHTLEIIINEPGVRLFAFTFG